MTAAWANLAVIAATVTTFAFLVPQIVKLVRTGDSAGVSTTWPALGFVSNVGWFIYMIHQHLWASMPAPFGTFIAYAITMWALRLTGRSLRASYMRGFAWALILVAVTGFAGWVTLGVVLGLSYGVMMAPSLWTAFRTADPSGISAGTWWIGVAEAILWGLYGLYHSDSGILTFAVVGTIGSALMLGRYYATRPSAPATAIGEP